MFKKLGREEPAGGEKSGVKETGAWMPNRSLEWGGGES